MTRATLPVVLTAALAALGRADPEMTLAFLDRVLGTASKPRSERPGLGTPGAAITSEANLLPYRPWTPATLPPDTSTRPWPGPPVRRAGRIEDGPIASGFICSGDSEFDRCLTLDVPGNRWHP